MLELRNISKQYKTGELVQRALDDVSIAFRESEFVAVLGPSGSGKTTLLNIVGGLDRYDEGDLIINSVSTKEYSDRDWDTYRNHTIGFVFQNYNLIQHQSVLANVELALTISGVSRAERRKRAKEALASVGLGDQLHKRPNQMSGGQMQRVAIARALVNDPNVLLADEPTGALDSETSVQVMELLKQVAKDRLVIMVTHNGELADEYANRVVRLRDGRIIDDSNPFSAEPEESTKKEGKTGKKKKASMRFLTALSLSLNNLRTKKGRTILTAFAGSIGIIGIAMILALSTGIHNYVDDIQRETLASYPVEIEKEPNNFLASFAAARESNDDDEAERDENTVYSNARIYRMFNAAFTGSGETNDLASFKTYLEERIAQGSEDGGSGKPLSETVKAIHYDYGLKLNVFFEDAEGKYRNCDLSKAMFGSNENSDDNTGMSMFNMVSSRMPAMNLWSELIQGNDGELIHSMITEQYDLLAGEWPGAAGDIVLILNEDGETSDNAFFAMGMIEEDEIQAMLKAVLKNEPIEETARSARFDELLGKTFRLVLNSDMYRKTEDGSGFYESIEGDEAALGLVAKNGLELRLCGIIKPNSKSSLPISGAFGYTKLLTDYVIEHDNNSELVTKQRDPENENTDLLTGLSFVLDEDDIPTDAEKAVQIKEYFSSMNDSQKVETYTDILAIPDETELDRMVEGYLAMYPSREALEQLAASTFGLDPEEIKSYLSDYSDDEVKQLMRDQVTAIINARNKEAARAQVMQLIRENSVPGDLFGVSGYHAVASMFDQLMAGENDTEKLAAYYDNFMPSTVSGSTLADRLAEFGYVDVDFPGSISLYAYSFDDKEEITNAIRDYNESVQDEEKKIEYTDYVALLMSGVTTIIDAVSYGLIAFVTISLVVSSIMIGIITYISVLERTKEIGILRSIGASKRNISSVFNAETLIIGFFSGLIGIGVTILLCIPLNAILHKLTGIQTINAILPAKAAIVLVLISMALTLISGLIPAGIAARKDPVAALRTE
ncbi:MAG: ABC transporter ATP-binding protein/permease [Clostridia bacterium]|nr:ABC transporter ATP-binding protein/permease [Clostridia bacterium]